MQGFVLECVSGGVRARQRDVGVVVSWCIKKNRPRVLFGSAVLYDVYV